MPDLTVGEMFQKLPGLFQAEKAGLSAARVQFSISGEGGGDWIAQIRDGACTVTPGIAEGEVDLNVAADAVTLQNLAAGKQNPMMAFMQGKVRVKGDMALAQKLVGLFRTQ